MNQYSPVKIWRKQKKIHQSLGKRGRVVSWTKIQTAPADFAGEAPYFVVLVKTEDKSKMVGQLVDYEGQKIKKGLRVKAVYRRMGKVDKGGVINYGLKFIALEK